MDESVSQTRKAVTEVTHLARSLQEGAGPQIDLALNEAQTLLDNIKQSLPSMIEKFEESKIALDKANELHNKMALIALPLDSPSKSLKSLKNKIKTLKDNIADIKNYIDITKGKTAETTNINNANKFVKNIIFYAKFKFIYK